MQTTSKTISLLTLVLGLVLLVYMIVVEDEPGLIPLLLIAVGAGWYSLIWLRG